MPHELSSDDCGFVEAAGGLLEQDEPPGTHSADSPLLDAPDHSCAHAEANVARDARAGTVPSLPPGIPGAMLVGGAWLYLAVRGRGPTGGFGLPAGPAALLGFAFGDGAAYGTLQDAAAPGPSL